MTSAPLLPDLADQHVLVLGLGASGLAMARWCAGAGARVTVADTRAAPPQLATLQQEWPQTQFMAGALTAALLQGGSVRAVYCSPGLSPAEVAIISEAACAMNIRVGSELDLFSEALMALQAQRGYQPKVLAVTGTNGKTTVTALTGQLVARAGHGVAVAGNIGPTLLDTLGLHMQADTLPAVWVLELSSFQLHGATRFEPTAAVVLNLTEDHLDWHPSMAHYAAAKARVFGQRALMLLNREDPLVMAMLPAPVRQKGGKFEQRAWVSFGADLPARPGDFGLQEVNGMVWLVRAMDADETLKNRRGAESPLHLQRLMPADALRIRGRHNAVNALAALALAMAAGCELGPVLYGLRDYRGEPHRVESLGVLDGVEYFDDSKGTNVGASVAALNGLGAGRKVVIILGGQGKGQDFAPLLAPVACHARAVVLIGRDAPQIRAALHTSGVALLDAADMGQAVSLAQGASQPTDAVLLSPACASFDMFDNYEHRAQVFAQSVHRLADAAGTVLEVLA